jgi:hypothetical protein
VHGVSDVGCEGHTEGHTMLIVGPSTQTKLLRRASSVSVVGCNRTTSLEFTRGCSLGSRCFADGTPLHPEKVPTA